MKRFSWLLAGAVLAVSGLAFAHDPHQEQAKDETEEAASDAKREAREATDEAKREVKEAQREVSDEADEAGEKTAGRAEAIGSGVADSAREAADAVGGNPSPLAHGELDDGDTVANTVTTNAWGLAFGSGINASYSRSMTPKLSAVIGGRFARAATPIGAVTSFGASVGGDYYVLGQNNEGLRVGPRFDLAFGGATVGTGGAFAGMGVAGELGYDWISSRGLTAGAGAGLRAGLGGGTAAAGDPDGMVDRDLGLYGELNLGYSW